MRISIIIVTYNSLDLIKDCIDSIFTNIDIEKKDIEIIVVDNSSDMEGEKLKLFLDNNYLIRLNLLKIKI